MLQQLGESYRIYQQRVPMFSPRTAHGEVSRMRLDRGATVSAVKTADPLRRQLLRRIGGAVAFGALGPGAWLSGWGVQESEAAAGTDANSANEGPFDVDLRLRAYPEIVPVLPGTPTEVWRYRAELRRGPSDTLTSLDDSYIGPMIRLRRGQRFRARLENRLPEDTTVHWHGLHVPPDADGQPRLPIPPGEDMEVAFDVVDRAGLYWYHPHPHGPDGGRVGFQSVAGLAGPLIIEDEVERALGLPHGEREFVLVLQDRSFTDDNQLRYIGGGMGSMMMRMRGFRGDWMLSNGRPDARRKVATQPYRLRLLNGSNSRIYKLAWSDGRPLTVIGTDGGLLAAPEQRPYVTLAPSQRIDLWVDFSDSGLGTAAQLVSDAYEVGMMMASGRFPLATFDIVRRARSSQKLPQRLAEDLPAPPVTADTPVRRFELGRRMMQGFTLNGHQMAGATVTDNEIVRLGRTEIWEFVNETTMPHPMHVHGLQFTVLGRHGRANNDLDAGLVDAGLHDTVLVFPGEHVRIALTFEDFTGFYIYHCHNMEHEDNGMMRYYRVDV